jgi:RHS repeat-associated protein
LIIEGALTWGPDGSGRFEGAGGVGGLLMMEEKPGSTTDVPVGSYYPLYDGNGNITQLLDAAGSVAAHYDYDTFGNETAATGPAAANNPWRFSTKALDPVSKFYYYGYRHYDPATGRWPSRDPIGEEGGVNLVGFLFNGQVNVIDRFGHLLRPASAVRVKAPTP